MLKSGFGHASEDMQRRALREQQVEAGDCWKLPRRPCPMAICSTKPLARRSMRPLLRSAPSGRGWNLAEVKKDARCAFARNREFRCAAMDKGGSVRR